MKTATPHGYFCAICSFSSAGKIIQKNPTHLMTRAHGLGLGTSNNILHLLTLKEQLIVSLFTLRKLGFIKRVNKSRTSTDLSSVSPSLFALTKG